LAVPGYQINRQDRTSHGGGVATYIREDLRPEQLTELQSKYASESLEATITKIQVCKPERSIIVIGVYRPPSAKASWFDVFNELVMTASDLGQIIIMGDLNANLMKPNEYPGNALLKSLSLARTTIQDIKPTRVTDSCATCLDIIAMSTELNVTSYNTGSLAASD
jgi:exonuclease III